MIFLITACNNPEKAANDSYVNKTEPQDTVSSTDSISFTGDYRFLFIYDNRKNSTMMYPVIDSFSNEFLGYPST